jgi:hypothetical protein
MVQGVRRVGFCELPSTVNEMTKGGGAEFKKIWDLANHFKEDKTTNRLVRYFTPAFDGYVGFIDKHGMSVIDAPDEVQYKYLVEKFVGDGDLTEDDIKLGARDYLLSNRKGFEGKDLEEEIRMNPFDEREMFMSSLMGCLYNSFKLNEQLDWLSYNEGLTERGNLVWEDGHKYYKETVFPNGDKEIKAGKLVWTPNPNGKYEKVVGWMPKEMNNVYVKNGNYIPNGNYAVRIGCDPFKYDKTKDSRRSDCAAYAYQTEDGLDADSLFNDMFVMRYVDRAATTDIQYEHVLKMAWFCGCQVLFERNVDGWKKYFQVERCSAFLMWLPNEVEPGIYTDGKGNTVQMVCDYTESYIEKHIQKVYFPTVISAESGWLGFAVDDTQKSDEAMSSGIALIAAKAKKYAIKDNSNRRGIESIMPYSKAV